MATIQELEKRIIELEKYIKERKQQQITAPLDLNSQNVVFDKVLRFTNKSLSTITANKSIKVVIDGEQYQINVL